MKIRGVGKNNGQLAIMPDPNWKLFIAVKQEFSLKSS